ncbi:hypothetical protein OS493_019486 [Desmophyllum pertusum]|uniref:Uncharacterized protein n=1 Tax=Desmophyllum pertusum TaxID=174260 RepID=A0A9X0D4R4_9CNID|nr:hypothetical protein OS493_019486 [Desmophyllum pertusum]
MDFYGCLYFDTDKSLSIIPKSRCVLRGPFEAGHEAEVSWRGQNNEKQRFLGVILKTAKKDQKEQIEHFAEMASRLVQQWIDTGEEVRPKLPLLVEKQLPGIDSKTTTDSGMDVGGTAGNGKRRRKRTTIMKESQEQERAQKKSKDASDTSNDEEDAESDDSDADKENLKQQTKKGKDTSAEKRAKETRRQLTNLANQKKKAEQESCTQGVTEIYNAFVGNFPVTSHPTFPPSPASPGVQSTNRGIPAGSGAQRHASSVIRPAPVSPDVQSTNRGIPAGSGAQRHASSVIPPAPVSPGVQSTNRGIPAGSGAQRHASSAIPPAPVSPGVQSTNRGIPAGSGAQRHASSVIPPAPVSPDVQSTNRGIPVSGTRRQHPPFISQENALPSYSSSEETSLSETGSAFVSAMGNVDNRYMETGGGYYDLLAKPLEENFGSHDAYSHEITEIGQLREENQRLHQEIANLKSQLHSANRQPVPSTEVLRYLKDFLDVNAEPDGSEFLPQHASVASQDYIIRANLEPRSTKIPNTSSTVRLLDNSDVYVDRNSL